MDILDGKPLISYPCSWTYRIVCSEEPALRAAIPAIVGAAEHTLASLGSSSGGRYSRVELIVTVSDEEQRNSIFAALGRAPSVRFVL